MEAQKPSKKQLFCPSCMRSKIRFETQKEALKFIELNAEYIESQTGKRPVRAYYCKSCCAWHLTSRPMSLTSHQLSLRFGSELGDSIYDTLSTFLNGSLCLSKGLHRKMKELKQMLKHKYIIEDKCRDLIHSLHIVFEIAITYKLDNQSDLHNLLQKFMNLCKIYTDKINNFNTIRFQPISL